MSIILSHPTSNENNRSVAQGLMDANILYRFYTTVAVFQGSLLYRLSSHNLLSSIQRRQFDRALSPLTKTWPWLEATRQIALKVGLSKLIEHEKGLFSIDAVYRSLDKKVARSLKHDHNKGVKAIYAYEDGAVSSFYEAKKLGIKCFYDLPIGYWRAAHILLEKERKRWPEWSSTLIGFNDSVDKLARKDEELRLADKIFVASRFTAETLQKYSGELAPVNIIPYGYPPVASKRIYSITNRLGPLKLLFIGGLSQRKGIADLIAVVNNLRHHVELTIVGHKVTNNCVALNKALENHRWIPSLPHKDILKLMHDHDVLVLPSLFEGFGLVITEAMSQGTPVITTDRTAGPDLIKQDYNGWLVEAGSTEALQQAIEVIIGKPKKIIETGKAAMESARQRPWEVYGRELANAIGEM